MCHSTYDQERTFRVFKDEEANKEELLGFGEYFKDINKEIPELDLRCQKSIQFFQDNNLPKVEDSLAHSVDDSEISSYVRLQDSAVTL